MSQSANPIGTFWNFWTFRRDYDAAQNCYFRKLENVPQVNDFGKRFCLEKSNRKLTTDKMFEKRNLRTNGFYFALPVYQNSNAKKNTSGVSTE